MKELQNGSDIRGIALEGVEGEQVNLTPEAVTSVARVFSGWLAEKLNKSTDKLVISVGMDSRISGPALKEAFINGLTSLGVKTYDFGLSTTPAMFMSTKFEEFRCDGAVMITASHLPFNRNGIKFFSNTGGLEKDDIASILASVEKDNSDDSEVTGMVEKKDFITLYAKYLVSFIRKSINDRNNYKKPLKKVHVIVDAGNGSGGFFVKKVLKKLGAVTKGSLFLDPDGHFPNHMPNPEDNTALQTLQNAVIKHKADLGIIFDTDVDRAAIVDNMGNPVHRNRLIALLSIIVLHEHPETYIVTDSVTSSGLADFIKIKNGFHFRYKRGYRNVINKAVELNNEGKECHLAIETSGHAAFKENYFLDDGCYIVAKVLVKYARMRLEGGHLFKELKDLREPAESKEYRIKITSSDFKKYGNQVIEKLSEYVKKTDGWEAAHVNYEGLRVNCDSGSGNGWFLMRLSLHDPVLALNIESDTKGGVVLIAQKLKIFLKEFETLDIATFDNIN